ncbi:MAG: sigma-54-dependent Fis family transcriptional regulator [Acidobacteria bacterium]|nr:MAG: sigma-54-dependent Fis family transcriptional regulator [Acidobacteriota bacterium]
MFQLSCGMPYGGPGEMNRKTRVLVVDDDPVFQELVPEQLSMLGFEAAVAGTGQEALDALRRTDYDVVLLDVNMPGLSGLEALREIGQLEDAPEVIMLTGDNSLSTGIEAMRRGAYDYLTKPAQLDKMEAVIRKADEKRRLVRRNAGLRAAIERRSEERTPDFVHRSREIGALVTQAEAAARHDSTVIITGESGTGKDVLTRLIHGKSARRDAPLIAVNCGALPEALFESEFFGHEKGAFTGANALKRGLIEAADGSTLFLDEVGDMPPVTQVKLLRFLEEGRFRRVGSTRDQSADVRVIAATNKDLRQEVARGRFRADLFYRLYVVSLHIPALRERPEDIPELIDHFLGIYRKRLKRPALDLTAEARLRMESHPWPGNVRELRNCLERAAALSPDDLIQAALVLPMLSQGRTSAPESHILQVGGPPQTLQELERQHILRVLEEAEGNRERASAILGISMRTLYRKLKEYNAAPSLAGLMSG